jgi:ABC-2 type transport system ATP-binding protein
MIDVEQIRKSYNGTRGLDGFELHVPDGELFGLVGPNGAGKTSLIKILSTLIRPDGGKAHMAGMDVTVEPQSIKRLVGYLPDQPGLYQDMRVREFLEFFADAFHVPRDKRRTAVEQGLARAGLAARSQSFVEELSFGMKQRLLLAKTLLHEPKVLLLDEPATGLDPMARIDLREHLKQLNAQGITILISSHILSDLEDICSRVALIAEGKNATDAAGKSIIELQKPAALAQIYEIEVLGEAEQASKRAAELAGVTVLETQPSRLVVEISGGAAEVSGFLRHLVLAGVQVLKFDHPAGTLELRYQQVFGDKPR